MSTVPRDILPALHNGSISSLANAAPSIPLSAAKAAVSVIKETPKSHPTTGDLSATTADGIMPLNMSVGPKKSDTPTTSTKSRGPSSDSDDISDTLDGEDLDLSDGDVSSKSVTNSEPDSDEEELARIAETKRNLEAKQLELIRQADKLREEQREAEVRKQKLKEQEEELQRQHQEEQRRRVAELTAHFEKEIKQQQFQLRMQKSAQEGSGEDYPLRSRHQEGGSDQPLLRPRHHRGEERKEKKKKRKKKKSRSGDSDGGREGKVRKRRHHHHSHREHRKAAAEEKGDGTAPEIEDPEDPYADSEFPTMVPRQSVVMQRPITEPIHPEVNGVRLPEEGDEGGHSEGRQEGAESEGSHTGVGETEEANFANGDTGGVYPGMVGAPSTVAAASAAAVTPIRFTLKRKADGDPRIPMVLMPVKKKRLHVTDELAVRQPLHIGWRRQIIVRQLGPGDRVKGDVIYYAPCGKKLRTYPEVMRYIERRAISEVGREHFSFSVKMRVGEFLVPKQDGEHGVVFEKISEEELEERLTGRKSKSRWNKMAEKKRIAQELARRANESKYRKRLEQQELARRLTEAKLRRKMERQQELELAREQRRRQGNALMMAEAKQREKERRKLLREQERAARLEQLRVEREVRTQQYLEERKKRKDILATQKIIESVQKAKEREIRRQQAVFLKHQERERRKQHLVLVRALEARKKAEERSRVRQEKQAERDLNREKRLQHRHMEIQLTRELKKPVEDMKICQDARPLPELPRIKGLRLPGKAFADTLMVMEFLHNFGEALGFDIDEDLPTLTELQGGLLGERQHEKAFMRLTLRLFSLALRNPGFPDEGPKMKSILNQKMHEIHVTAENMSEMMRYYLLAINNDENELSEILMRVPFKALNATDKAAILGFLINQLVCSDAITQQIDETSDKVSGLRRDKWIVEGKLRKLRSLHNTSIDGGSNQGTPGSSPLKKKRGRPKKSFSDYSNDNTPVGTPRADDKNEDEDDDGEDDDDVGSDDGGREQEETMRQAEMEEETAKSTTSEISKDEIQKKIERLTKQHSQFRNKIFEAMKPLRSIAFGKDRFHRRYWVFPNLGGLFVEGSESSVLPDKGNEALEEIHKQLVNVKKDSDADKENDARDKGVKDGGKGEGMEVDIKRERDNNVDRENDTREKCMKDDGKGRGMEGDHVKEGNVKVEESTGTGDAREIGMQIKYTGDVKKDADTRDDGRDACQEVRHMEGVMRESVTKDVYKFEEEETPDKQNVKEEIAKMEGIEESKCVKMEECKAVWNVNTQQDVKMERFDCSSSDVKVEEQVKCEEGERLGDDLSKVADRELDAVRGNSENSRACDITEGAKIVRTEGAECAKAEKREDEFRTYKDDREIGRTGNDERDSPKGYVKQIERNSNREAVPAAEIDSEHWKSFVHTEETGPQERQTMVQNLTTDPALTHLSHGNLLPKTHSDDETKRVNAISQQSIDENAETKEQQQFSKLPEALEKLTEIFPPQIDDKGSKEPEMIPTAERLVMDLPQDEPQDLSMKGPSAVKDSHNEEVRGNKPVEAIENGPVDLSTNKTESPRKYGFGLDDILARPHSQSVIVSPTTQADGEGKKSDDPKLPNGVVAPNNWFSILPRTPCDETSLTSSASGLSSSMKNPASGFPAIPFNPYMYPMAFPFMPVNQLGPYFGAYPFAGMPTLPMQPMPMMNGPIEQPLMPTTPNPSVIQPMSQQTDHQYQQQQAQNAPVMPEIKQEPKDDIEEEQSRRGLEQLKAVLNQIENAKVQPIPAEAKHGWWLVKDQELVDELCRCLHTKGTRERVLHRALTKHTEFIKKVLSKGLHQDMQVEEKEPSETFENGAPKADKSGNYSKKTSFIINMKLIESIENMEEKVFSANMHSKGWVLPNKLSTASCVASPSKVEATKTDLIAEASERLLNLEGGIERRFLKHPLNKRDTTSFLQEKLNESISDEQKEESQEVPPIPEGDIPKGLHVWRTATEHATSAAQLYLCLQQLEKCITWEKAIIKVLCQLCRKGDNEALLLLCDGCDKGFHTYCVQPGNDTIPEGDWFCQACVKKSTGEPGKCLDCQESTGDLLKCHACPRSYHPQCLEPPMKKLPKGKWFCPPCHRVKKKNDNLRKKKNKAAREEAAAAAAAAAATAATSGESAPAVLEVVNTSTEAMDTSVEGTPEPKKKEKEGHEEKKSKKEKKEKSKKRQIPKELQPCKSILNELEKHDCAWPFLNAVNTKMFPQYKKVIRVPMDFSTMRTKLKGGQYKTREEFAADARLVFDNCETFNEDESEVGQAGHILRAFFEKRWTEILAEHCEPPPSVSTP